MTEPQPSKGKVFTGSSFNEHQGKEVAEETTLSVKDLKMQLVQQTRSAKEKDAMIKQLASQNRQLEEEVEEARQRLQDLSKQVQALSKFQEEEQQKTQEEKMEEMHLLANALKIQEQAFGMFNGLPHEAILSIPVFEYEKGFTDSQICLCCFQPFQQNTNIKCLPCYHAFHQLCIDESLAATKYCPACQTEVVIL